MARQRVAGLWRAGPGGGTLPLPPAAASPLPPTPGGLSPAAAELPPSFGGLPPGALRLRTRTVTDSDRHGPDCRTTRTDWLGPCGVSGCGRHRRRDAGCGLGRTPGTDHNLSFISNRQRQKKGILYALWTRTLRPPAACPSLTPAAYLPLPRPPAACPPAAEPPCGSRSPLSFVPSPVFP